MLRAATLCFFAFSLSAQDSPNEFRVAYTGRLLGYARTPDVQVLGEDPSIPGLYKERVEGAASSPVASALRKQIAQFRSEGDTSLLLGLGDNFAMDFQARSVLVRPAHGPARWVRKDHLIFDYERNGWVDLNEHRGPAEASRLEAILAKPDARIGGDNVARFVSDVGFDAMVPGRQDFHFGPQRLRQIARLLASGDRKVPLLASNLVIRATGSRAIIPKPAKALERIQGYVSSHSTVTWIPPSTPLPWMRRVRLRKAFTKGKPNFKSLRWCPAPSPAAPCDTASPSLIALPDPDPRRPDWDAWVYATAFDALVFTQEELRRAYLGRESQARIDNLTGQIRQLEALNPDPGEVYPLPPDSDITACVYFDAGLPYCQTQRIARPLFDHPENLAKPYAIKNGIVIVGAVNPGMERSVGVLNTQWLHEDPSIDVSAVAVEPAEAISQVLEYCRAVRDCVPGTRYLLLAQMPEGDAETLNRRLRNPFLAVFAQADDFDSTSPVPVEYPSEHAALTFVPPPVYSNGGARVALRTVRFRRSGPGARHELTTGSASPVAVRARADGPDCLSQSLDQLTWMPRGMSRPDQFSTAVLSAMRRAANADAAILQQRDLFELEDRVKACPEGTSADPKRVAIEGILWKGDLLATRTITGSQLKAVLAQSDVFDALDRDPYAEHGSPGQGLVRLGLMKDSGTWFVNGQAVLDNRLYTIAMPDFLAFGDTGYPDLRRQPVPPAIRASDFRGKILTPIASLVAADLGAGEPSRLPANEYLDWSRQLPPNGVPRASFGEQFREQIRRWVIPYPAFRPDSREALGQGRTYWRLVIDQGQIGYSEYRNNQPSATEIGRRFKGITESGVHSRESRVWLTAAQAEVRRETPSGNLFSRVETGFATQVLQAAVSGGDLIRNYLDNRAWWETGIRRAVWGNARQRPWTGLLASVQTATQLRQPFELLPGASRAEAIPRTTRLAGKFGARMEGRQNWIETGVSTGWVNRPLFDASGALNGKGSNRENGWFVNFNAALPLPRGIGVRELTFTNRTQFYWVRDSDLAVDTRLLERFEAAVTLPIWGNVSLRPTYGVLMFENKKAFNFLTGRTFSVRVDYRFDRSSGASWRQVLGFGRP